MLLYLCSSSLTTSALAKRNVHMVLANALNKSEPKHRMTILSMSLDVSVQCFQNIAKPNNYFKENTNV